MVDMITDESSDEVEVSLDLDALEIELNHSRVSSMAVLSVLTKTECLGLRNNIIKTIEGINQLLGLRELELYDNQITRIENLDALVHLESVLEIPIIYRLYELMVSFCV